MSDVLKKLQGLYQAGYGKSSDELFSDLLNRAREAAKNGDASVNVSMLMPDNLKNKSKEFKQDLAGKLKAAGLVLQYRSSPVEWILQGWAQEK